MAFVVGIVFSSGKGYLATCHQPLTDSLRVEMVQAAEYIRNHTAPDDKIMVCGGEVRSSIYVLSGRMAASRYAYQFPVIFVEPERQKEFMEQLGTSLPKIIAMRRSMPEFEPMNMDQFLKAHAYQMASDYPGTDDLVIYALPEQGEK